MSLLQRDGCFDWLYCSQTQNIRYVGSGHPCSNHAPLIVAEQFGTLEILYPNPVDLGLGRAPGTDGLTASDSEDFFSVAAYSKCCCAGNFLGDNATAKCVLFLPRRNKVPIGF
jgi:hypothetical protein